MRKYIAGDLVIPELLVWALRGLAERKQEQMRGAICLRTKSYFPSAGLARGLSLLADVAPAGQRTPRARHA